MIMSTPFHSIPSKDPVIDPDGHTYERGAILHWIQGNNDSPITRKPLEADQLYENTTLLDALIELTEGDEEELIHPSIRRWKTDESERRKHPTPTVSAVAGSGTHRQEQQGDSAGRRFVSNRQELDEATRAQRRAVQRCTVGATLLAVVLVAVFVPSLSFFVFVTAAVFICLNNRQAVA